MEYFLTLVIVLGGIATGKAPPLCRDNENTAERGKWATMDTESSVAACATCRA
jgi:hypothetical protein